MKPRILLSAYFCSPCRGGEAAVGWQVATRLAAAGHEVVVLCGDLSDDEPTRKDHASYAAEHKLPDGLTIHYVAADPATRRIHHWHCLPGLWFLYYQAYRKWQQSAYDEACKLHASKPFDAVHHLTVIGYREPGDLWQLGIPFFWGPVNGAASMPWRFIPSFGWRGIYRHVTRNLLNALQMRTSTRCRAAARAARHIWAVTEEDRAMVEGLWGAKAEVMLETGTSESGPQTIRTRQAGEPLRLVWSGWIEARKALPLVLRALALMDHRTSWRLDVLGDGPDQGSAVKLAAKLGIAGNIRWHGFIPREQALQCMRESHVLLHSSVKEGTPHVVLEALALGLPVICHAACGMGVAVDEHCGLKIPMKTPGLSIAGFHQALQRLESEKGLLESLSAGARKRAGELSWDHIVRRFVTAYERSSE